MLQKTQLQLKRLTYRLRRDYLTLNNVVVALALLIALSWTWSSIEVMQQNYELQRSVDAKRRQLAIEELRVDTLELEGRYYTTFEYQELAVRQRLGRGMPGERVVIVPSTDAASETTQAALSRPTPPSNFQQWIDFLLGATENPLQN